MAIFVNGLTVFSGLRVFEPDWLVADRAGRRMQGEPHFEYLGTLNNNPFPHFIKRSCTSRI
jgi:hypothetical protein